MTLHRIAVLALIAALAACSKPAPPPAPAPTPAPAPAPAPAPPPVVQFAATGVTLGNAVNADNTVLAPMSAFATSDTIYAAVATVGAAPTATLSAKWTYQDGQVVNESSQTIAPTGAAVTTFNIQKPDGWPVGKYAVEITVNGAAGPKAEFEVK
jgi:hypothetical protein